MNTGVFGQLVGYKETHPITLYYLNGWTRRLAVVTPQMRLEARRHFAYHRFGHQMKLLHTIVHAPGQCPTVRSDHWVIGATSVGYKGRHRVGLGLDDRFGQCGHGHAANRSAGNRPTGDACCFKKTSSRVHRWALLVMTLTAGSGFH
jgi:hypothetical protein